MAWEPKRPWIKAADPVMSDMRRVTERKQDSCLPKQLTTNKHEG